MPGGTRRIARQSVSAEVAEFIREQIFAGELGFGTKIPQDAIAEELGVSRLPVREAIVSLEADGMVVTVPHRGTFVADIAPEDLLDHYGICGVIHGLAAGRAAAVITTDQVAELTATNDAMAGEQDAVRAYELHWSFHQTINRVGGSRRLRSILQQLSHQLPHSLFTSVSPADIDSASTHAAILEAFRERDAAAASDLCREHLEREGRLVVDMLRARGLWAPTRD